MGKEKKVDEQYEVIERTANNGLVFSIKIDRFDVGMKPRIREVATKQLEKAVLWENLSLMDEWKLRLWCEDNIFDKTSFLCPHCHGFGPVTMKIVTERVVRQYLLWKTEADEEVKIYRCLACQMDYKQNDLEIEQGNTRLANEHRYLSKLVALKKISPDDAIKRAEAMNR